VKDVHIYNNEEKYTDEGIFSKKTTPNYAIVHGAEFRCLDTTSF
jgi:hypothetical protein